MVQMTAAEGWIVVTPTSACAMQTLMFPCLALQPKHVRRCARKWCQDVGLVTL